MRLLRQACVRYGVRGAIAAALLAAFVAGGAIPGHAGTAIEAVDPDHLRVCADPDNLPYSNEKSEGFENKIAELLAKELHRPLLYTWHPMSGSFFPDTLNAKACDLVIGLPAGLEAVLSTNPYYRITYVMVYRKDSGLKAQSLADPVMKKLKIGTVAGSVPNFLIEEDGLLSNMVGYQPFSFAQTENVGEQMMDDLKDKKIDVALMTGPQAGYWAKKKGVDVVITRLENAKRPGGRMDYFITMGVRHGEDDWKHEINDAIKKIQPEINKILASYNIPVLQMVGTPVPVSAASGGAANGAAKSAKPEPQPGADTQSHD